MKQSIYELLPGALLPWYEQNQRALPWRQTKEPYRVWLSEIMLQQTRVEAVKGYYGRFLENLPNVASLATCDDELLYKLWEGLGYYNRVRNMKKCARILMDSYGGDFPRTYEQVLALPGIGEYTAGAICSICFGKKTPAVDGNVLRVIARLTREETSVDLPGYKKQVRQCLMEHYPDRAGDFTQALMELGATVCVPNGKPACDACPCRSFCAGFRLGDAQQFPVRTEKKARKTQEMTVFILSCDGKYALRRRPETGLLAQLWEFPNCDGKKDVNEALSQCRAWGISLRELKRQVERSHIFTHVRWDMRGYYMEAGECVGDFAWLTPEQIEAEAALPTAFRQFWEENDHV